MDDPELRQDVESAALLGLTEAAERYDADHGEPFFAFAVKRVRGAALDELRRADRLPRRERARAKRVARAVEAVEARTGRAANDNDVAREVGISVDELESTRARIHAFGRVPFDECHEHTLASATPAADELVERARRRSAVAHELPSLAERDRAVLELSYQDELSLREIGERLGVTESRVCQLRSRALATLRARVLTNHQASNDMDVPPPMAARAMASSV